MLRRAFSDRSDELATSRLLASLTAEQCQTMRKYGWFEVMSNRNRRWRIYTHTYTGNCLLMPDSPSMQCYCAHLSYTVVMMSWPLADHLLAQALMIRTDEEAFLRIAY